MHIYRRGTRLYRVEWGIDKGGERFVNVDVDDEGDERFARQIERWVTIKFEELDTAHDKAVSGRKFAKVEWVK